MAVSDIFTFTARPAHAGPGVVRVAVKDLIDVGGVVTTNGSRVVAPGAADPPDRPAVADAACLAGIRAGEREGRATIVGKTNMHELAFGVSGINPWFGTPTNPLDAALVPGGSSSGSAVAVATGAAEVALGSDTGGSIRIPAACCGVVGLKTTRGRVPLRGVRPLAPSLDTIGPMAGSVATTGLAMTLLEPGFVWQHVASARRIGRFRPPADEVTDGAVDSALLGYVSATGATTAEIDLPGWTEASRATLTILSAEAWHVHRGLWEEHRDELSPDVAQRLELGSLLEPEEVAAAWETARAWAAELAGVFRAVDLVALPTLGGPPPPLSEASRMGELRHTLPANLAGVPALAQPVVSAGAVPASLQFLGPAGSEALLLATGAAVESVAGWRA